MGQEAKQLLAPCTRHKRKYHIKLTTATVPPSNQLVRSRQRRWDMDMTHNVKKVSCPAESQRGSGHLPQGANARAWDTRPTPHNTATTHTTRHRPGGATTGASARDATHTSSHRAHAQTNFRSSLMEVGLLSHTANPNPNRSRPLGHVSHSKVLTLTSLTPTLTLPKP